MQKTSTSPPGDFHLDDAIGHLLRRAYQRTSAVLISQISEFDITPVQFATLARLHEYGMLSQNQLGRLVDIEPGNFHGVINRLLNRGLVIKQKDEKDQRKVNLSLSEKGRELVTLLIPMSEKATATTLASLTTDQRNELYALLNQILEQAD